MPTLNCLVARTEEGEARAWHKPANTTVITATADKSNEDIEREQCHTAGHEVTAVGDMHLEQASAARRRRSRRAKK